ncbi:MAG: FadR/GntR family transcriptional regulator [Alphaproteobacteria bacterium]
MSSQEEGADRRRVSDRVAAEVLRRISSGQLAPGEKLPGERMLAEQMNVSRVSVRAALQRLQAQGFLSAVQGGGTRVVSPAGDPDPALAELVRLDRTNLRDLAEMRSILEVWAARRAARNATPEQLGEIAATVEKMERGGSDRATQVAADVEFHHAVAHASGSAVYVRILSVIRDILTAMQEYHRYELFGTPADDAMVQAQHRAAYEAIRRRDPEAAGAAMQGHLDWVLSHYRQEEERHDRIDPVGQP